MKKKSRKFLCDMGHYFRTTSCFTTIAELQMNAAFFRRKIFNLKAQLFTYTLIFLISTVLYAFGYLFLHLHYILP